jgi:hypothetical protein
MPTQANVDEIAEYLRSFKDGSRKHNQTEWHSNCGTAHCLAGWKVVDDYHQNNGQIDDWKEEFYTIGDEEFSFSMSSKLSNSPPSNPDRYCRKVWGLTFDESESLFESYLTLEDMMANLCKIAKDHDLIEPKF